MVTFFVKVHEKIPERERELKPTRSVNTCFDIIPQETAHTLRDAQSNSRHVVPQEATQPPRG